MRFSKRFLTMHLSSRLTICADDNSQETPQLSAFVAFNGDDSYRIFDSFARVGGGGGVALDAEEGLL